MTAWSRVPDALLRTQSDERLVALTRAGHERAFAALVERYRRPLVAFARRIAPEERAEDVVQQALTSAWAALAAGAQVEHLRGWLYQIVRHESARLGARESRERHAPLDPDEALGTAGAAGRAGGGTAGAVGWAGSGGAGADAAEEAELRLRARATLVDLARLPERQRDALVQTALEGRSRTEIAASMGVSEGAVRQLVHRARATLRAAATALTPLPLADWAASTGGGPGVAELAAGAGGATVAGLLARAGVIVVAGGAIATGVAVDRDHHTHRATAPAAAADRAANARAGAAGSPGAIGSAAPPRRILPSPFSDDRGGRDELADDPGGDRRGRGGGDDGSGRHGGGDDRSGRRGGGGDDQSGRGGGSGQDQSRLRGGDGGSDGGGGGGGPGPSARDDDSGGESSSSGGSGSPGGGESGSSGGGKG